MIFVVFVFASLFSCEFAFQLNTKKFNKVTTLYAKTLFDKIWDSHLVDNSDGSNSLIYIDRHLVHEVTSPQAFEGLRNANRIVRRPDCTLVTGKQ